MTCACVDVSGIYFDAHDINTKRIVQNAQGGVTVTAFSPGQTTVPGQSWEVTTAPLDATCSTGFQFNVPYKPSPPPELLDLVGKFTCRGGVRGLTFTAAGAPDKVLNVWARLGDA